MATAKAAFQHASEPQPVPQKRQRAKYREEAPQGGGNIMFDRRVVRGNTYAAQVITQAQQREIERLRQEDERRRRAEALRRKQRHRPRPNTPPAVPGRSHMQVQTEEYVEVLTDRPEETDASTQTEAALDKPLPILFVPRKSGVDKETQIEDGELFDFDFEAAPVLEVLVSKTLENAMVEVLEEAELAAIRAQQAEFETMRDAELAEVQRLESQVRRRAAEKERRVQQKKAHQQALVAMKEQVEARGIATGYMRDLQDSVFQTMEDQGLFFDSLEREVETNFMPWLLDATTERVNAALAAQDLARDLLADALGRAKDTARAFRAGVKAAQEAKERRRQEELDAERRAAEERRRLAEEAAAAEEEEGDEGEEVGSEDEEDE